MQTSWKVRFWVERSCPVGWVAPEKLRWCTGDCARKAWAQSTRWEGLSSPASTSFSRSFPTLPYHLQIGKHKCTQVYPQVQTGPGTPIPMEEPERSLQVLKAGLQRDSWSGTLGWFIPQMACLQVERSSVKSRCETVCRIGESISHHLRWLLWLLRMREESPKI